MKPETKLDTYADLKTRLSVCSNWDIDQKEAISAIEALETACMEWADVSQSNYKKAKLYHEALTSIARHQYGLQSIMEEYDTDSKEFYEETTKYYSNLVHIFQKVAREAIKDDPV